MSINQEITWVKRSLQELKDVATELGNAGVLASVDDLESNLEDLISECESVLSVIEDVVTSLGEI